MALRSDGFIGGWWARRKVNRLRSQADRAERRAAGAIQHVSATFGTALEAVLQAAVARVKAEEARLCYRDTTSSRRS
jgi:hypothetical protein